MSEKNKKTKQLFSLKFIGNIPRGKFEFSCICGQYSGWKNNLNGENQTIECQDCGVRYKFVQQKNHFHIYIISLENIINSSYECNCSCHQTGAIHIVACCDQCKICGKNIKIQMMNKHLKTCHHKK
ncbi:hypothetical protein A2331_00665 [Candidatus Falkowbacteria bacterium RIFOXYB2_FULL_34_18]|uniref:Uncharacterized protein n=1 Tax=Candidatus Falkowbacteria bacterium RIFOXYD2_FULL_34_120 TaxID=1798007 RepID=A0A1F5TMB3_9BACT|nr:MAG: hypothetical protein A2331_00665 [Candidatus Falkowbacteria bacterium RIFOXYB2_FULL_34_18]OGF29201.1 MAG: hypothetical protein A2500_05980 [Candidatus Falkowbacteria bacterium RIFOXYC12_FULL_34_55]OGF37739.1 MAG: hypothetical protein A2466_06310 [Candidatus Falkowbacteria bacterium RIFOXYC2_FULL_34_220]OGF38723.1 MAG: hypothetical protein A2515_01645 [Candidatus Falkowbacteria bacterium RIFOXYD12_FULL_34_57]OGF39957.1 MAG: hypothetical protein A2531_01900 [Candidatus Falkowbacteria bact